MVVEELIRDGFENKGEAIGVTLHHPDGQIYGYPFVPPRIKTELTQFAEHHQTTGKCLLCDVLVEVAAQETGASFCGY